MIQVTFSVDEFFKELREVEDTIERSALRFQLQLAQRILYRAQDNVKKNFGAGTGEKSPITLRAYGSSARRQGRSGALFNSGMIQRQANGELTVSFGGPGVPYAGIQEWGGKIFPRKPGGYLTLPYSSKYAGTRAGEHSLKFAVDANEGAVLVKTGSIPDGSGSFDESEIAYLLRRSVTIRPRPYFQPAVDAETRDDSVRELMMKYFGARNLQVST